MDLDELRRMMREAGAEDAVDELIGLFVAEAPGWVTVLETSVAAADAGEIARAAHAYKSARARLRHVTWQICWVEWRSPDARETRAEPPGSWMPSGPNTRRS